VFACVIARELLTRGVGVGRYDEEKGERDACDYARPSCDTQALSPSLFQPPPSPPLSLSCPLAPYLPPPLPLLTAWQGCPAGGVGDPEPYEKGRYSRSMCVFMYRDILCVVCVFVPTHAHNTSIHVWSHICIQCIYCLHLQLRVNIKEIEIEIKIKIN
jgi:hypothetical protein